MNLMKKKNVFLAVLASAGLMFFSLPANAHVVVRPAEVVTAGFTTFTMGVPNEKDIPTTSLKLVMPEGLQYVSPSQKAGWTIDVEKSGEGESAVVKSITWSGSAVNAGFRDDFTFSAKVPGKDAELQWKAYQTYSDGTVVSWDKAGDDKTEGENSGPFSVTKVVSETKADAALKKVDTQANDSKDSAETAMYVAIAAGAIALVAIYLATKKKSS